MGRASPGKVLAAITCVGALLLATVTTFIAVVCAWGLSNRSELRHLRWGAAGGGVCRHGVAGE